MIIDFTLLWTSLKFDVYLCCRIHNHHQMSCQALMNSLELALLKNNMIYYLSSSVGGDVISSIGRGLCVLIGIHKNDTKEDMEYM